MVSLISQNLIRSHDPEYIPFGVIYYVSIGTRQYPSAFEILSA